MLAATYMLQRHPRSESLLPRAAHICLACSASAPCADPEGEITCGTCFCEVPQEEGTRMQCGHLFCNDCWRQHLAIQIADGRSRRLPCMGVRCPVICDEPQVSPPHACMCSTACPVHCPMGRQLACIWCAAWPSMCIEAQTRWQYAHANQVLDISYMSFVHCSVCAPVSYWLSHCSLHEHDLPHIYCCASLCR